MKKDENGHRVFEFEIDAPATNGDPLDAVCAAVVVALLLMIAVLGVYNWWVGA